MSLVVLLRVRHTHTLHSSFLYFLLPDKPEVILLSGNRTVNEGSNAFLYCKAVAYPTPVRYNWFIGFIANKIISDPNGEFVIDSLADGRSRLTVKQVKHERIQGIFLFISCSGTNVAGTGRTKFYCFNLCEL